MRRRFKSLCREADVTVDGEVATPKNGRTYHYNLRAKAESDLLEMAAKLARDQGASDAESVRDYYLTDEQRSRYRRIIVRERLRRAVPELTRSPWDEAGDGSYSLSDFE
jgi:hypothetical protein